MLKKLFILLVTLCYFLSVTGTTIDKFYCCGKLKKTSIFFSLPHSGNCSKKIMMKKGCCRYDESFYKLNDSHQSESIAITPSPFSIESEVSYPNSITPITIANRENKIHFSNGPLLLTFPPEIYLLNCNFRI